MYSKFVTVICFSMFWLPTAWGGESDRPNILVAIADDQSYPHASVYGDKVIKTPALERLAKKGVVFNQAFTPAPGCSPMRAAFLTGRNIWQIEHAGTHASSFARKYPTYQQRLQQSGYEIGFTGKGWAPGKWDVSGRDFNPAGPEHAKIKSPAPKEIRNTDYAANFEEFLNNKPKGKPFSFWYGGHEPHRKFKKGIGIENGMDPNKVTVPAFLPDTAQIRSDILDYGFEIQWFDKHLGRMLDTLEKRGELDNTIIVVTSDNGMAFPRAKANVYEYGIHMPLVVAWPKQFPGGRTIDDLVNLIDVTATLYDATGVKPPAEQPLAGSSLLAMLKSNRQGLVDKKRDVIYCGRERHSSSRYHSLGYPQRCIRTQDYLYIRNFKPERWPAGSPPDEVLAGKKKNAKVLPDAANGYFDIDSSPSLNYLYHHRNDPKVKPFFELAVAKRPAQELYDIRKDPGCLHNLANDPKFDRVEDQLNQQLVVYLAQTGDARVLATDGGDIWEDYPRYSGLRKFKAPDWVKDNAHSVPKQTWIK
jgi:N-sulfoglucosamine sulfohydrolase